MQCNIDARGKAYRLILGIIMMTAGATLLTLHLLAGLNGVWVWYLGGGLLGAGLFGVFEGWAGWCLVRAMGFKTRV